MSDNEFNTVEEYNKLQRERYRMEGSGLETKVTVPCPFCCAPDFQSWTLLNVREVTSKECICTTCGRGLKGIFKDVPGGTHMSMVQTCGPDANLPWFPIPRE